LDEGHRTLDALQDALGVGTCCGCCLDHVVRMVHHAQQSPVACSVQPELSWVAVS
jgi:bacterioferritin-associated ferredoxin